tara:strand:- start:7731 stop:7982 length:252 start_codon:yes stop_codon:yes gene_type:complete
MKLEHSSETRHRSGIHVIDMHGVRHVDVEDVMIDACSKYQAPFIVITGHSVKMKQLVSVAVAKFGYLTREEISNSGRLIVDEE